MGQSIKRFARNVYSQFGEDGIIEEVLKRLDIDVGQCCEFGANDGIFCSNTYNLLKKGWGGKMIEGDQSHMKLLIKNVGLLECNIEIDFVTPYNANKIIPHRIDLLSIDCDGPDAGIWEAYTGTPDLVIIEINSSLDPDVDFFTPEKGANYSYMKKLGERKGYFLLCHTGNMLFVRNEHKELFPDADETFVRDWLA